MPTPRSPQVQLSYVHLSDGSDTERDGNNETTGLIQTCRDERFQEVPTTQAAATPWHVASSWAQRALSQRPHVPPGCSIPLLVTAAAALYLVPFVLLLLQRQPTSGSMAATPAHVQGQRLPTPLATHATGIMRIAFGSCTAYDLTYQTLWEQAVIPSQPDAWLWVGDFVYLDTQPVNCDLHPDYPGCTCDATWLHHPPYECAVGDLEHAARKWRQQLYLQAGYQAFLGTMCPGSSERLFPPPGVDTSSCPRPVLGIYDDHDYGWNNGNRRLPRKWEYKNLYLDALGEPQDSPRRNMHTGAHWQYTLNAGSRGKEVDVILLDGRYHRDPLPCGVRRAWCEEVLQQQNVSDDSDYVWCKDFLLDPQPSTVNGSCCTADDIFAHGWCQRAGSALHRLWPRLCDPTHMDYAQDHYVIRDGEPVRPDHTNPQDYHNQGPMCEVLGQQQRKWFQKALRKLPAAPLHLIVSGSVLLGNPAGADGAVNPRGPCGGDDWECYKPAQAALIASIAAAAAEVDGCWVLLVGDYHQSDIKVISSDMSDALRQAYPTAHQLPSPLFQVMASGMTNSTANPFSQCEGWRKDLLDLRPLGECAYVNHPAFGVIEVDWGQYELHLQIRFAENGSVAQQYDVNLASCRQLQRKR